MSHKLNNRGFTLLEVMVAGIVLTVAISGLAAVFVNAARQSQVSSHKTVAFYYANEMMQRLSSFVADDPDPTNLLGGFAAPESAWFTPAIYRPGWQSCTGFAGPMGDCYALADDPAAGVTTHFVDPAALAADFTAAPINGNVRYTVETDPMGLRKVSIQVNWTEPAP